MKYRNLMFDLDDTLLDFDAAEHMALPQIFDLYNFPLNEERHEVYRRINFGLWRDLEEGRITRDELMSTRFALTFAHFGLDINGREADEKYRELLTDCKVFVEGAYEVVEELSKHFNLYIASNGVTATQHKRLQVTGLKPFFKHVIVSEETGTQKPFEPFFHYAFERIENFRPEETLMIGDSLTADIAGGNRVGIDTCWLNWRGKSNTTPHEPTYEINKLADLHVLLRVKATV